MNVEREIQKENAIRKIRNVEMKRLREIFLPFVGSKIRKADGDIVKKITDLIEFDKNIDIEPLTQKGYASLQCIYLRATDYSLYVYVSICFSGGDYEDNSHYCEYKHNEFYIGNIENKVLAKVYDKENMPMLDADEQRKQYDKVQKINIQLETEKNKLFYGIRYD